MALVQVTVYVANVETSKLIGISGDKLHTWLGFGSLPGVTEIEGVSTTLIVPLTVAGSQLAPKVDTA